MEVGQLWVKLGLDKSNYDNGMNESKGQASGFGNFIKNALQFTVGQGMFDLLKTGMKSAWDMSIGYNATLEQNTIAFNTMLGSADKAGKLLDQLQQFAAKTPFQFPELADASKKMLAFGFSSEQIMPILKSVGDAASGLGGGSESLNAITEALGKIQTSGKVSAREMLEFTTNGVPAWDILAKAMGKTIPEVQKLSEKGLIPANVAINDLVAGMEQRFPNMMDKQSRSFNGLMSTLKDNVQMTLGGVLRPQFEYLTSVILPKAIELTQKVADGFKAEGMQGVLKAIFPAEIVDTLDSIGTGIQKTLGWIEGHGTLVKTVIAGIAGGFIAYKVAVMASIAQQEISNGLIAISAIRQGVASVALDAMEEATGSATIAQWALNSALAVTEAPIALVVIAIGALVAALIYLWNTNEGFRNALIGAWNSIKEAAISIWNGIAEFIKTIVTDFVNFVNSKFSTQLQLIKDILVNLKNIFLAEWDLIKNVVLGIVLLLIDLLTGNFSKFKTDLQGILNNISNDFSVIWTSIKNIVSDYINIIVTTGIQLFNDMKNGITTVVVGIKDSIVNGINAAVQWIKTLPSEAYTWGADMIQGMINGIKSMISSVTNAVKGVADSIRSFLHFSTPDQGPLADYESWMPDFMEGLASGVDKNKSKLISSLQGLSGNMAMSVKGSLSSGGINNINTSASSGNPIVIYLDGKKIYEGIDKYLGSKLVSLGGV